jgi:hypothetical protein
VTALDDALNSGTPQFDPTEIIVDWRDAPSGGPANPNEDNPRDLTRQIGSGGWSVQHSFEDGLPDPVTMTTGNDANGHMTAEVLGREGVWADSVGWRTTVSGTGTGSDALSLSLPADASWDDYCLVQFTLNRFDAVVTDASGQWETLSRQQDGDAGFGLVTYVFGSRWFDGLVAPVLDWNGSYGYSWVSSAAYARTADGLHYVTIEPDRDNIVSTEETVSGTNHTAPFTFLQGRRGWLVGMWASIAATPQWTAPTGHTELGEAAATVTAMMSTSPLRQPVDDPVFVTASTAGAAGTVTMTVVPLRIMDRDNLEAYRYFSPFLEDSPVYGYDREGNPLTVTFNVVTEDGPVGTQIFKGQTADISLQSEEVAELTGFSKARIDMNAVAHLPKVWGQRLEMSIDWVVAYLMAYGGQFIGPAPTRWARYWVPYYGSVQPMLRAKSNQDNGIGPSHVFAYFDTNPNVAIEARSFAHYGPHHLAMFAERTLSQTTEIFHWVELSQDPMPHQLAQDPEWVAEDSLSQTNSAGRISFWIRMDEYTYPSSAESGTHIADVYLKRVMENGTQVQLFGCGIRATDRNTRSIMDGQSFFWSDTPGPIPQDGQWHFVGFKYDLIARKFIVMVDGVERSEFTFAANPNAALVPLTDAIGKARGDNTEHVARFWAPVSDFQWEVGLGAYNAPWTDLYPPKDPGNAPGSFSATVRPTWMPLEGLFNDAPYPVWDTLAELAQASAAWYRTDEGDGYNFLPLEYFGEEDQMTSVGELDTLVNAQALRVTTDSSRQRNSVTVKFLETRIDTNPTAIFTLTSSLTIPRGFSRVTFALDRPVVESWSEYNPGSGESGNWTLDNLTANHANGTTPLPTFGHYIFFNRNPDGGGEYLTYLGARARIVETTATTVTIEFQNTARLPIYVVNNGQDKPFMVLRGTGVNQQPAYVTVRDEVGVRKRGERSLEVELAWVQNRAHATEVANRILAVVHLPRSYVRVRVMGDPRRKPGQLFTIKDAQGTAASGTWRAVSVVHEGGGPQYTQTVELIRVGDVFTWDQEPGWDQSVWGE